MIIIKSNYELVHFKFDTDRRVQTHLISIKYARAPLFLVVSAGLGTKVIEKSIQALLRLGSHKNTYIDPIFIDPNKTRNMCPLSRTAEIEFEMSQT